MLETALGDHFKQVKASIKDMALGIFVPIYFAGIGFNLDLIHHFDPGFFLLFLLFATVFKMLGTVLSARLVGESWLSSVNLGAAMNTRGGPGIVLATVAYGLVIISENLFTVLVMVAIITSLMAGYWFKFVLNKRWELLPDYSETEKCEVSVTSKGDEKGSIEAGEVRTRSGRQLAICKLFRTRCKPCSSMRNNLQIVLVKFSR
jgi:hypothetical protein